MASSTSSLAPQEEPSPSSSSSSSPSSSPSSSSPSLDTLVSYLLAAKRSLSCLEHVSRANELVTDTRHALESHTILTARTIFLRNASASQTEILVQVRDHITSISREASAEYDAVIKGLDAAEARLSATLDQLRSTIVEAKLRPEGEGARKLVDFVDEAGVRRVLATVKDSIDATNSARSDYGRSVATLEEEIVEVKGLLSAQDDRASIEDLTSDLASPVPAIIQDMESHAHEMANNLESLVRHFDLCTTAIRHTEGGGAAASKATDDLPDGMDLHIDDVDAPPSRISDEERAEMMLVLQKDAAEVEEVVLEVRDRIASMESSYQRVLSHGSSLSADFARVASAFRLLEDVGSRLSGHLTQSHLFLLRWDDEKAKIADRMRELSDLRDFYAGFLTAYDNLIIEVGRRKDVQQRMARIRADALAQIEELYAEDVEERDLFRQEQGDFLPVDIWPGLMLPPARYEIATAEGLVPSVPDISASVIQKAIRRVGARSKDNSSRSR